MLPEGFASRFASHMTTGRRRLAITLATLFSLYSLFGFFVLPGIIQKQAKAFVENELGLAFSVEKIEFNPWRLALRLDKFAIQDPTNQHEKLIAARSLYLNADILSSLWIRGASLYELDLLEPYVNAHISSEGLLNLMKLVPANEEPSNSSPNWRIGRLGIHQGKVDLTDESRHTPFTTTFSPLNVSLADLSSRPDKDGGYTLHAETGEGEALDWKGTVALNPVRSEGELKISHLKATTPWRYLQDELPVVVEQGLISISGKYSLVADEATTFTLKEGHFTVDNLMLSQHGNQALQTGWKKLDVQGIHVAWPEETASFSSLNMDQFFLTDKATSQQQLGLASLVLNDAHYQPQNQQVSLENATLNHFTLASANPQKPIFVLPRLSLRQTQVSLSEQTLHIVQIDLKEGLLALVREKDGSINLESSLNTLAKRLEGFSPPASSQPPATAPTPKKPWLATLGELDLNAFTINFSDLSLSEPLNTTVEHINLRLFPKQAGEAAHRLDGSMAVASGGTLSLNGRFTEQPLSAVANIQLKNLNLPPFAPLATDVARFALEKGALNVEGQLKFQQDKTTQASFNGNVAIHDFAANDLDMDERFLAWNRLAINNMSWQLAPEKLAIREIQANKPFIRVIVNEDQTINLSNVVVASDSAEAAVTTSTQKTKATTPFPLKIDHIKVSDGSMLFADMSLRPQFATGIQSLEGDIRGLSSQAGSRATVALKGRVDEYGKADISGTLNPLAGDLYTDIGIKFSNVELTTLTPYSSKFAGYRIDKGKLSLDLNYKINDRKLNATNKVVLDQLTLGEKVKSPDATSLPLKLAVAILKDKNGVIDIDLPVTGSLDDPKFKIGPLIWKTLLNLLTRAATAPFSVIAGMVGGGDNMDALPFVAGSSQLQEEVVKKLTNIASAVEKRPLLSLEIQGSYDPNADAMALRTYKFDQTYQKRLNEGAKSRKILEDMYREKLGSEALAQQRALSLKPVTDTANNRNELQLAIDTYEKHLRSELIARETILDGDLRQLALDRARAIRNQLIEAGQVEESRVFVMEPGTATAVNGQVVVKINLTAP